MVLALHFTREVGANPLVLEELQNALGNAAVQVLPHRTARVMHPHRERLTVAQHNIEFNITIPGKHPVRAQQRRHFLQSSSLARRRN